MKKKSERRSLFSVRDSAVHPRSSRSSPTIDASDLRLVRPLAAGATSAVYEALSLRDGRRFALKVLMRDGIEPRVRFTVEAAALATIGHANVVEICGHTSSPGGRPCIVMPLLVGETLRARLDVCGRMAESRAVETFTGVLAGVAAAHAAGVLHRDLAPRNIILGHPVDESPCSSRPILVDFGLAKLRLDEPPTELSRQHPARGNLAYMAPEQILGRRVDARTDVYAAGVLLFEAIAGRPPFVSDDPDEVTEAQLGRRPPSLDRVAGASKRFARAVSRALEKDPSDRYPSAGALAEALNPTGGLTGTASAYFAAPC